MINFKRSNALLIVTFLSVLTTGYPINILAATEAPQGSLNIYVDPTTGALLPQDQAGNAPTVRHTEVQTEARTASAKVTDNSPSQSAEEKNVTQLPGGGRMIDLRGRFTAQFTVYRSEQTGALRTTCATHGHHSEQH